MNTKVKGKEKKRDKNEANNKQEWKKWKTHILFNTYQANIIHT